MKTFVGLVFVLAVAWAACAQESAPRTRPESPSPGTAPGAAASPTAAPGQPVVVYVQPHGKVEPVDHWLRLLTAFAGALPALLAAVAAFIQSLRNASKADENFVKLQEIHSKLIGQEPPKVP